MQKNSAGSNQQPASNKMVRIQHSVTGLTSTVLLIKYNQDGNIASVNDSVNGIDFVTRYDGSGDLVHIVEMQGSRALDSVAFAYNAQGQMTGRITTYNNTLQVSTFYYSAGELIGDSTHFYDNGSLFDSSYATFQFTNGDLSLIQFFDPDGPVDSIIQTHTSTSNPFKQLSLFNWTEGLQNRDIASPYTYFDQHVLSGYRYGGAPSNPTVETATYTYNSAGEVTEAKSIETNGGSIDTFDWVISYQ